MRFLRFLPLALFSVIVAALLWRLAIPGDDRIASRLVGQPLPTFSLPPAVAGSPGLKSSVFATGGPKLLNIFASWCVPCAAEAGILERLKQSGVEIDGIAVRDRPDDVARFLARHGNPFERIGSDLQSEVQIALGSSGVPESFVIDRSGIIRYQHIGAIEEADIPTILAELEKAR